MKNWIFFKKEELFPFSFFHLFGIDSFLGCFFRLLESLSRRNKEVSHQEREPSSIQLLLRKPLVWH